VSSSTKGVLGLTRLTGSVSGDLDVTAEKMGTKLLAENVMIYQTTSDGAKAISLSQIPSNRIPSSGIVYARTNWAGRVDLIVLSNVTGSDYVFGLAEYTTGENEKPYLQVTTPKVTYKSRISGGVQGGTFVGVTLTDNGEINTVLSLNKFENVSNNAWSSTSSVTIGGRSYTVPSDVLCYNKTSEKWASLNEARAFATSSTLYTDQEGYVRAMEVR